MVTWTLKTNFVQISFQPTSRKSLKWAKAFLNLSALQNPKIDTCLQCLSSPSLKNYSAVTFMTVHMELATSRTHGTRFVTPVESNKSTFHKTSDSFKALLPFPLMFHDCVIKIGCLQTISFQPRIRRAAEILLFRQSEKKLHRSSGRPVMALRIFILLKIANFS